MLPAEPPNLKLSSRNSCSASGARVRYNFNIAKPFCSLHQIPTMFNLPPANTFGRKLFGGGDFLDDCVDCGTGIRGGQNGAAYDQEIGAGFDGFGRGGGAGLIVGFCA